MWGSRVVTILKSEVPAARSSLVGPVRHAVPVEDPEWWTYNLVKERLVEAWLLWRRSPGGGRPPFATDGPWMQMMSRDEASGDYDARGTDGTSSDVALRAEPLGLAEVAERDRVSEWLRFIDKPADRRLVVIAVSYLASGRSTVPWRHIKHRLRIRFGEAGLRKRFDRALRAICEGLNAAENRM